MKWMSEQHIKFCKNESNAHPYTRKDDNEIILEGGDATEADLEAEGW